MGHLVVKDCHDEYDAKTAKGWINDASGITRHTTKGWLNDANIDKVAHVKIHDLIEAEDVRGCFDERPS